MATKTITIMNDAFKLLRRSKRKSESYSEVIRREFKEKSNIMELAGAWKDVTDKEVARMKRLTSTVSENTTKEMLHDTRR